MIKAINVKNIISKKAQGNSALSGQLYQMFFFEQILKRISKSKYKHNIILKGGLLLSSIIGNDERATRDMDATLKSIPLNKENVLKIFNEILNINIHDNITFEIIDIKDIRLEDEYGGFKINVLAKFENLKVYLFIELTTGDKITPREIEYNYNCIFSNENIPIFAYTLETIIAEKFQTIVSRGLFNTRMKDFYDIHILINNNMNKININNLKLAIKNTFKKRETEFNKEEIVKLIDNIKNDSNLNILWNNYQKNTPYTFNIKYQELFDSLNILLNII